VVGPYSTTAKPSLSGGTWVSRASGGYILISENHFRPVGHGGGKLSAATLADLAQRQSVPLADPRSPHSELGKRRGFPGERASSAARCAQRFAS